MKAAEHNDYKSNKWSQCETGRFIGILNRIHIKTYIDYSKNVLKNSIYSIKYKEVYKYKVSTRLYMD